MDDLGPVRDVIWMVEENGEMVPDLSNSQLPVDPSRNIPEVGLDGIPSLKEPNKNVFKPAKVLQALKNVTQEIPKNTLPTISKLKFPETEIEVDAIKKGFLKRTQVYFKEVTTKGIPVESNSIETLNKFNQEIKDGGVITNEMLAKTSQHSSLVVGSTTWEEVEQALSNPKLQDLICNQYERLKKVVPDKRYGNTYEKRWDQEDIVEREAVELYSQIRELNNDVEIISKNTGIDKEIIEQVKNHVFYETHRVCGDVKQFAPDIDMAKAWMRLIKNDYVQSDIRLIIHEYSESLIMKGEKVDWRIAHQIANVLSNWENLL